MEFLAHVTELEVPVGLILFVAGAMVGSALTLFVLRRSARDR